MRESIPCTMSPAHPHTTSQPNATGQRESSESVASAAAGSRERPTSRPACQKRTLGSTRRRFLRRMARSVSSGWSPHTAMAPGAAANATTTVLALDSAAATRASRLDPMAATMSRSAQRGGAGAR